MPFFATLQDVFNNLIQPWIFMSISLRHLPSTIRSLVASGDYRTIFWPPALIDALFGNFWATVGPVAKSFAQERVVPLLEGRVTGGRIMDEVVGEPVRGVVLEIGAGSGMWADVFAKFVDTPDAVSGPRRRARQSLAHATGITKIYGVEPHPVSAAALRRRVKEAGLGDIYEVVPVGIESLADPDAWAGDRIEPGSVDCIVSVLCLCSIPEPEKNIRRLYELLKPGGRWYAYEHVKAERGGWPIRFYQRESKCSRPSPKILVANVACRIHKPPVAVVRRLVSSLSHDGKESA